MNPSRQYQAFRQPHLMYPESQYKPIYAHNFQPKSGIELEDPPENLPLFYSWSPACVGSWLTSIGFGRYRDLFLGKNVDGMRLYHMGAEVMHRVGVVTIADANQIISHINALEKSVEKQKAAIPPGMPYHHYKSLYFGEENLYSMADKKLDGCSK